MTLLFREQYRKFILHIACLTLLYFIAGYLGLLLAIPPGYSTAVSPASGLALAGLLLFSNRLWPGVFLGSFLVNLISNQQLNSVIGNLSFVFLSMSVATGATLQALLGSYLIRKQVDIRSGLLTAQSIIRLLAFGGPISCLIAASWGVSSLWLYNVVSSSELAYSWTVWWVGDSIGVLLMLPISFIFFAQPQSIWRQRRMSVALPILVTLVAIISVFVSSSRQENENIKAEFSERAYILAESLEKKIITDIEVFHSVQSLFITNKSVTREQFKQYVQLAMVRNTTIQAISWNPVILKSERNEFVSMMKKNEFTQFEIKQKDHLDQLILAPDKEKYVVVSYIEPFENNEKALGFDIYSDEIRKKAIDLSTNSGRVVATAPIQLVQEEESQFGVLFLFPVINDTQTPNTNNQNNNEISGFVVGVLRLGNLLSKVLVKSPLDNINVFLTDVSNENNLLPFASFSVVQGKPQKLVPQDNIQANKWDKTFQFANRSWQLSIEANNEYMMQHRSWSAWAVLTGGLLFSSLLGMFLLILSGHSINDKKLTDELTNEINSRKKYEKELELMNQKLGLLATTDPLTQVHNRRAIMEIGAKLDAEVRRFSDSYSVMMIDVDHFKNVNDRWGHDIGDIVLKEVADRISQQLRESDYLARWGGEEFLVIAQHSSNEASLEQAKRICREINRITIDPVGKISISIGVATHKNQTIFSELVSFADKALYQAKESGRNQVVSNTHS